MTLSSLDNSCTVGIDTRQEISNVETAILSYECTLQIPDNIGLGQTKTNARIAINYDGLKFTPSEIPYNAWYIRNYTVELLSHQLNGDELTAEIQVNRTNQNDDTNYFRNVSIEAEDSVECSFSKLSEDRYTAIMHGFTQNTVRFNVFITEDGCPTISYPFSIPVRGNASGDPTRPSGKSPSASRSPPPRRKRRNLSSNDADRMRIDIITVLPEMLEGFVHESILARAEKKGLAEIRLHNLRDYTLDKWRRVDDYPYGGSAGMVMQCEPIDRCISALKAERDYDEVIFTSPDGERFDQHIANELSLKGNLIILAGHYKGIDQRIRDHLITREISIGDFVLTGGELVAAMIADAVIRVVPGVIGDEQSALSDCFQDDILAAPIYTRPADYKGWKVPEILLSGNEAKIREWELDQAMERTRRLRPDLLDKQN